MLFVLYLIVLREILGHFVSVLRYPIDILFHPPVFPAPRTTRLLPEPWLLLLLSSPPCFPACSYLCPLDFLLLISTTIFVVVGSCFQLFLPSLILLICLSLQSRFHHPVSNSALEPDVPKTFHFSFSIQPT